MHSSALIDQSCTPSVNVVITGAAKATESALSRERHALTYIVIIGKSAPALQIYAT